MLASSWLQLEVSCSKANAEYVGAALIDSGSIGLEERALPFQKESPTAHNTLLVAYFDADLPRETQRAVEERLAEFNQAAALLHWSEHRDDGWSTRWKSFFRPLHIGSKIVICPTWEEYTPKPHEHVILIDPGMAFGTGHHATTRSCLLLLEDLIVPDLLMLDVGCGSGILSLGALKLGVSKAIGVDIDSEAVQIAQENAALNQLSDRCEFSATPIEKVETIAPLVVANIQAHILNPMVHQLRRVVAPEGTLLLSGILGDQANRVRSIFEQAGFSFLKRHNDEEWVSLLFRG